VPEVQINMSTGAGNKDLTQVVRQLLADEGRGEDIKGKKLNFMVKDVFVTTTLQDLIDKVGVSTEATVEVWYSVALDKPKPHKSIPQDEWISSISALKHIANEKAKTYVVGFFNGDIKVFSKHDHSEVLSVK